MNNEVKYFLGLFLMTGIVVPLIVTIAYNIHIIDAIFLDMNNYLSYLGVCFGLIGSAATLAYSRRLAEMEKRERDEKERMQRRPRLSFSIVRQANPFYLLIIHNIGSSTISDIFLIDSFVASFLRPGEDLSIHISFDRNIKEGSIIPPLVVLDSSDTKRTSQEGYPESFYLHVYDEMNYQWECRALLLSEANKAYTCEVVPGDN